MYINGSKFKARRYSSGELKLLRSDMDRYIVDNKVKIVYLGKYSLFELLLIVKYYKKKSVFVDLTLSYLPYQRMDHEGRNELDTVNYVASVFNDLGLDSLTICEPHCEIDGFNNVKRFSYVEKIKDRVFEEIDFNEEDCVVLTDKGGLKRYGNIAKNVVYFNKERDIETGLIIKHGIVGNLNVRNKVVIVDDIISTGDTIVNIIEYLEKVGVENIYVLSGHIENNKYNKRIFDYKRVIRVYSSNSLKRKGNSKLKLFNVNEIVK